MKFEIIKEYMKFEIIKLFFILILLSFNFDLFYFGLTLICLYLICLYLKFNYIFFFYVFISYLIIAIITKYSLLFLTFSIINANFIDLVTITIWVFFILIHNFILINTLISFFLFDFTVIIYLIIGIIYFKKRLSEKYLLDLFFFFLEFNQLDLNFENLLKYLKTLKNRFKNNRFKK